MCMFVRSLTRSEHQTASLKDYKHNDTFGVTEIISTQLVPKTSPNISSIIRFKFLKSPPSFHSMAPTIPKTARAVVLDAPGAPFKIREVPVHLPERNEVRRIWTFVLPTMNLARSPSSSAACSIQTNVALYRVLMGPVTFTCKNMLTVPDPHQSPRLRCVPL